MTVNIFAIMIGVVMGIIVICLLSKLINKKGRYSEMYRPSHFQDFDWNMRKMRENEEFYLGSGTTGVKRETD